MLLLAKTGGCWLHLGEPSSNASVFAAWIHEFAGEKPAILLSDICDIRWVIGGIPVLDDGKIETRNRQSSLFWRVNNMVLPCFTCTHPWLVANMQYLAICF